MPKQVGDNAGCEIFDQTLMFWIASQIAQWCDGHGNAR